jgi:hypothetical protein
MNKTKLELGLIFGIGFKIKKTNLIFEKLNLEPNSQSIYVWN